MKVSIVAYIPSSANSGAQVTGVIERAFPICSSCKQRNTENKKKKKNEKKKKNKNTKQKKTNKLPKRKEKPKQK